MYVGALSQYVCMYVHLSTVPQGTEMHFCSAYIYIYIYTYIYIYIHTVEVLPKCRYNSCTPLSIFNYIYIYIYICTHATGMLCIKKG